MKRFSAVYGSKENTTSIITICIQQIQTNFLDFAHVHVFKSLHSSKSVIIERGEYECITLQGYRTTPPRIMYLLSDTQDLNARCYTAFVDIRIT